MSRNIFIAFFLALMITLSFTFFGCSAEKSTAPAAEYDVVIVGAGGGGLSAAAQLSLGGKKVLVIEQHDKVGGYMTAFDRDDYRFEVSLHAFDGIDPGAPNHTILEKLDILDKIKPIRLDPMYRAYSPDFMLDVPADVEAYLKLLKEKFPHEKDNIDKFDKTLTRIDKSYKASFYFMNGEYGKGVLASVKSFWSFFTFFKYMDATIEDVMDDHFSDPKLISVICQLTGFLGAGLVSIRGRCVGSRRSIFRPHRGVCARLQEHPNPGLPG